MIYRISIQATSQGIDREVYSLHLGPAESLLVDKGHRCVRKAEGGVTPPWLKVLSRLILHHHQGRRWRNGPRLKDEAETVFNPARTLKLKFMKLKLLTDEKSIFI
jgi:hypothetical protein